MTDLYALAAQLPSPSTLSSREPRYRGEEDGISVYALGAEDLVGVQSLYRQLGALMEELSPAFHGKTSNGPAVIRRLLAGSWREEVLAQTRALGRGLQRAGESFATRKALHDLRGGSLQGLLIHLDLIEAGIEDGGEGERAFILARDHRKMMRNALVDLDSEGYDLDLEPRPHRVALLEEKWDGVRYQVGDSGVDVVLEARFHGSISERCMELAALDRVLYNLVNNAARFTSDGRVRMGIYPVEHRGETHLRFTVANAISPVQRDTLRETFGQDLGPLFRGGFTTGGHGVGLGIVADVVAHGYDLTNRSAIADDFLGARIIDDDYVAWFFWPAAG